MAGIPTNDITVGGAITAAKMIAVVNAVNGISMLGQIPTVSGSGVTVQPGGAILATNSPNITVIGAFSSTYDNYRIAWNFPTQSANADLSMRLTTVGTDNTSPVYAFARAYDNGSAGTRTGAQVTAATTWLVSAGAAAGQLNNGWIDLFGPALSQNTSGIGQSGVWNPSGNSYMTTTNVFHGSTTTFDGFTLYPQSGNITGTVRVYGYNNLF